ncbi:MAG TPA: MFS transporter [Nocardioides sp.]|nr:MFS transporter [Nocardioides sp.]
MTALAAADAGVDIGVAARRRVLATLCFTQLTGWGVLFYGFPVLQGSIAADTGWSPTTVSGAFTLGQVVAAIAGVAVGRLLDRRGPWLPMTVGSGTAVLAVLLVASAGHVVWFALGWLLAGAAMAAVLYAPAFAAITGWFHGRDRIRALTVLTVAGGLASTVFGPLTATLHAHLSWRSTYVVLAGVLLTTVPAHAVGLRAPWQLRPDGAGRAGAEVRAVVRSRAFAALGLALALTAMCSTAVIVSTVPMLREHGMSLDTASLMLGLGGPGQVAGRLCFAPLAARIGPVGQTVGVLAVLAVTTALLAAAEAVAVLVGAVLAAGAARGALTLVKALAVSDRWGPAHYARLSGVLALPVVLAAAAAPWASAWLASYAGSYGAAFLVLAGINLLAVGLAALTSPTRPISTP